MLEEDASEGDPRIIKIRKKDQPPPPPEDPPYHDIDTEDIVGLGVKNWIIR